MASEGQDFFVFVGTFTAEFTSVRGTAMGAPAAGISVFRLDGHTGKLTELQVVGDLISPSFVARHPREPFLYAVERQSRTDESTGSLTTFTIDPATGGLTSAGRLPSGGQWPSHVAVHPSGKHAYVANIASGTVASFPISAGRPGAANLILDRGTGACHAVKAEDPRSGPRTHSVAVSPGGDYALVCDMGAHRAALYRVDPATGAICEVPASTLLLTEGSGPRHAEFHPTLPFVYVSHERACELGVLRIREGQLELVEIVSSLPEGADRDGTTASDVHVHPNGRFAYVSNRRHNTIAVFALDATTGQATPVDHQDSLGEIPRIFSITPDARHLLVANQASGRVVTFALDPESGRLLDTGHAVSTPTPVSIAYFPAAGR
jgi:6-phosphogluconolactonase